MYSDLPQESRALNGTACLVHLVVENVLARDPIIDFRACKEAVRWQNARPEVRRRRRTSQLACHVITPKARQHVRR